MVTYFLAPAQTCRCAPNTPSILEGVPEGRGSNMRYLYFFTSSVSSFRFHGSRLKDQRSKFNFQGSRIKDQGNRAKGQVISFAPYSPITPPKTGLLEAGFGNIVEKHLNVNQYNILNNNTLPIPGKNYKQSGVEQK